MTPELVVLALGAVPAFALGWMAGALYERNKRMNAPDVATRAKKWLNQYNVLTALVVVSLVAAVIAAVYAYGGKVDSQTRDDSNFECLALYVSTSQGNNKPATLANRAQSAAWRDYERGYSTDPDAKNLSKSELKARWLTLYKVYEDVQVPPLPDLRKFCEEN